MWFLASVCATAALAGTPKASSELKDEQKVTHSASLAFDGLLSTGWAESDVGAGVGAWVELKLDRATPIAQVSLWPGNLERGKRSLREYGRPKLITVTLTTDAGPVTVQKRILDGASGESSTRDNDAQGTGPARVDIPIEGNATAVRVSLDEVFEGTVYNDTYIAEIALNFARGTVPPEVQRARKWQDSKEAERAEDRDRKQIIDWFDKITKQEFGNQDTLELIMARAGDGAPFMRDRAKQVPYGFRAHAIPPDGVAIDALLKLKDANGIPAIELAATRAVGDEAKELTDKVEYFYAYQELVGGGNRNVQNYGQTGWEVGALRGFGEPMQLVADHFGDVFVADIGNSRVQMFDRDGKSVKQYGPKADITNTWYSRSRRYYVSGSKPGEKAGQFVNPLDIALLPGKDADGFAVLDARGRIQLFDPEGNPLISWAVRTDDTVEPGVGGEGYIEVIGSKIAVVWGHNVFVYNKKSEELKAWEIDRNDGIPKGTVALKGGKLGVIVGRELVMYSLDGFRHGTIVADGDARGEGFEDWDVTVDNKGKLWAVTDTGVAVKYKKPGVVEYAVKISEVPLDLVRATVSDDIVYALSGDHIYRVDALEQKRKAEEAAAAGGAQP
jgi:hypothetical protein